MGTVALFLPPDEMRLHLVDAVGHGLSPQQAEQLFDLMVLRGRLRPAEHGLWELDTMAPEQIAELAKTSIRSWGEGQPACWTPLEAFRLSSICLRAHGQQNVSAPVVGGTCTPQPLHLQRAARAFFAAITR